MMDPTIELRYYLASFSLFAVFSMRSANILFIFTVKKRSLVAQF